MDSVDIDAGERPEIAEVSRFVRLDRLSALLAIVFVIIANGVVLRIGQAWIILPFLALLVAALFVAEVLLESGRLLRALGMIAFGNWVVAIAVPVLFPFLWPVMALTVLMPMVLASPHLSKPQIGPAIVLTALVACVVGAIGLSNDDGGVIDDIDDAAEFVLVLGALTAQTIPIGLIAWQHNARQRQHVVGLSELNRDLRASEVELATSRNRVVEAADYERRRIERDLHDGAQQSLVALGLRLRLLESRGYDDPGLPESITSLISGLDEAVAEVRELSHGIYPPLLQTRGLPDALAAVARKSPLEVRTDIADIGRLDQRCETALYFAALEALTNAAKHATGATVELRLWRHDGQVAVSVIDDGPGFDVGTQSESHGLLNMRDRLAAVGGTVAIESTPNHGTTVTATLPVDVWEPS